MAARVLVTGLWHETNTFSPIPTDLAAFEAYQLLRGAAVGEVLVGTNTEIGGMIAAAPAADLDLVFGLFAGAVPAGTITAATYQHLVTESLERAAAAAPVAGALVALHGAMVAADTPDADAVFLQRLRAVLGADCPIVATFDIHANLSPALFAAADVLIGYDTYPHTDMGARGREAVQVLGAILASGRRPAKALRKLPLVTVPQMQATAEAPMHGVIEVLHGVEAEPGIATASVAVGFPYADVGHLGVAVVAYGDEQGPVEHAADHVAATVWTRRHDFLPALTPPEDAVRAALAAPAGPVVLVDVADNVGGGASGDGTVLLEALLAAAAEDTVVVMWAPGAAARCGELGVGGHFEGRIGGSDPRHGAPVALAGAIELARSVTYRRASSYMTGQEVRLGQVGVVRSGGVRVVLTEQRAMPFDADHLRVLDIAPESQKILVCKSAIGWRAAFGDLAADSMLVATPGICSSDLAGLDYRHGQSAMFPLDPSASWGP